jgi:hypothetical protein
VSGTALSPPAEVTLATCIGCGAMSLSGRCPAGCAQERKLELVLAAELDELTVLADRAQARAAHPNRAWASVSAPRSAGQTRTGRARPSSVPR